MPPIGNGYGTITGMNIDHALQALARDPRAVFDVAELALHLARDEYPLLDVEAYLNEIEGMAHEVRSHLKGNFPAKVAGLCRYLFHDMGFRGSRQDYYDPRNSYLNQVIDRRTGIPITLSGIVMAIGARIGIEIQGVGLPGHFVVKAVAGRHEILFDPFNSGRILTPENCEQLVKQVTGMSFQATKDHLEALPLGKIVRRMLGNLKAIYMRDGDSSRAIRIIERLRQLDPHDPLDQRDLGVLLLQAGQPGKAIDLLSAYLDGNAAVEDGKTIRELLERAQTDVARWN
ncbi:MAG TPA: transglutaminase-like domain-containing protein [Gemmataceae bacterium]|nr:transglutaminase-like domain-containing protein [Gemmataceae bacterium]